MTELFNKKVTIFNEIAATENTQRSFIRKVLSKCQISGQIVEKTTEMIRNVVNAKTVITKDVERYKEPLEYTELSVEERETFYTVQVGDIVVLAEVDDEVTNALEFANLQQKYEDNCIKVTTVSAYINGMAVDNVTMTNA